MEKKILESKYIFEYISDMINEKRIKKVEIPDSLYHHNTDYTNTPSAIKYGLLSLSELNRLGIQKYSDERLRILDDHTSHVNGIDKISLALTGLTDLYRDEDEYDPHSKYSTDILIDRSVRAGRSSYNYGNEFLAEKHISSEYFRSIDFRILELMKEYEEQFKKGALPEDKLLMLIRKYNALRDIALSIKEMQLDIPLREMTKDNLTLDIDKVEKSQILVLK